MISLMLVILLSSCNKDARENRTYPQQPDFNPASLITNFSQKMDDFKKGIPLKSGERLSIDSAIWYIDATLNYYYAKANHPFGVLHIDTTYVEMNVLGSYEAMYAEVFASYDASLYGFGDKYYAIEGENKQFIMAIVDDLGPLTNNKRKLSIITLTGTGSPTQSDDFGEDDAYYFNRGANTNCFGFPTQGGAPEIFEEMLNNHYNPDPGNNCRWYFYGAIATKTFDYLEYPLNDPLTNYLDYKIFAASQSVATITWETECLEWNQNNSGIHEMQFYYDNLIVLIDVWLASEQNTNNLKFASSTIDSFDRSVNGYRLIKHIPTITFRKRGMACTIAVQPPVRY
jgi:hypothetical protein